MQPAKIVFFPNGHISASDENGQHMPELQAKGWLQLYLEHLESQGIDPTQVRFEGILNDGQWKRFKPYKTSDGAWSYEITGDM